MNPKHHISVRPETRHNGDGGPLVFHFIPKEKTSPDGWEAICGAFIPDRAKTIHCGGTVKNPELPDVGASSSVICPLCVLVLQLDEDIRDAPKWTSRYRTADRFITELTIINKLGKEQQ